MMSISLFCAFIPSAVSAQSVPASSVTPQNLVAPKRMQPNAGVSFTTLGPQAPVGADRLEIAVGKVNVEGGFPELSGDTTAIVSNANNHKISVARIYEMANAIEQAYARKGFVLARVVVPPQRLKQGGSIKLLVIDGFIEQVDVHGVDERVRIVVAARAQKLVGRRHVLINEIEHDVLVAGDISGLGLKSALARGQKNGGSLLVLEGQLDEFAGYIGVNNQLPASLGQWQMSTTLSANSVLGLGEQTYVSLGTGLLGQSHDLNNPPLWLAGAGMVLPLGTSGLTINPEYIRSSTHPNSVVSVPDSTGTYERASLGATMPVIWDRTQLLKIRAGVSHTNESTYLPNFGIDLNQDSYNAVIVGADWQVAGAMATGSWLGSDFAFTQGVGGRNQQDADASLVPLSRQGASPFFSKLTGTMHASLPLAAGFGFDAFGRGQSSFGQPLLSAEQFALDAPGGLTSAPDETLNADAGLNARAELSHAIALSGATAGLLLTPYLYGATGRGWIYLPTSVEVASFWVADVGVGLRFDFGNIAGLTQSGFQVEVARRFSNIPGAVTSTVADLALNVRF